MRLFFGELTMAAREEGRAGEGGREGHLLGEPRDGLFDDQVA